MFFPEHFPLFADLYFVYQGKEKNNKNSWDSKWKLKQMNRKDVCTYYRIYTIFSLSLYWFHETGIFFFVASYEMFLKKSEMFLNLSMLLHAS